MTKDQFCELLKDISGIFENTNQDGSQKNSSDRNRTILITSQVLYATLLRLRKKWSYDFLAWFFGENASTLKRGIDHMMKSLFTLLDGEISMKTPEERFNEGHWFDGSLRIVAALDGYLQPVQTPPEKGFRLLFHSGKLHDNCLSILALFGLNSKWLWRSQPFEGSIPDTVAINMPANYEWTRELRDDEFIVADKAFYDLIQQKHQCLIPGSWSHPQSREISALRSIVEQGWAALQEWEIIKQRWTFKWQHHGSFETIMREFYQTISIIMGINNRFRTPFRSKDDRPSSAPVFNTLQNETHEMNECNN